MTRLLRVTFTVAAILLLGPCALSFLLCAEYSLYPTPSRRCEVGINFGAVYFATKGSGFVAGRFKAGSSELVVYDARPRTLYVGGAGFAGLGISDAGTTPGGGQGYFVVSVPLWLPAALLIVLPAVRLAFRRRVAKGLCRRCGYDLRATPERCPECGTPATIQEDRE